MGAGASAAAAVEDVPCETEQAILDVLENKLMALELQRVSQEQEQEQEKEQEPQEKRTVPGTLAECLTYEVEEDADAATKETVSVLAGVLQEQLEALAVPEVEAPLRTLPDALDQMVYQHERWPVLVDPLGQGARFIRYQRGTFLLAENPLDVDPENLRRSLVGALRHGTYLVLQFDESTAVEASLEALFDAAHFPREVLCKAALFREDVWAPLLRPAQGDPEPDAFQPKDDFKLVIVTKHEAVGRALAGKEGLGVISVLDAEASKLKKRSADPAADAIASALGVRDVKRNSVKLVEAAFDGEWGECQDLIDKGYSVESTDPHEHTPLSEAACQGHLDLIGKLLDLDADPNAVNDTGRSPLFRASYNGHLETCEVLLRAGGDPRLASALETPFDVAKTEEVRALLEAWDVAETERLVAARRALAERRVEEKLSTAAERDAFAREKIRVELVGLAVEGKTAELKERLQELADEATQHNERPRGFAEVRDDRGNTLLLLAVWKNHSELAEMLLSEFANFDPEFEKVERKVFFANVKARDAKGWNAAALATFHGHKRLLQVLLEKGCDPYVKNSYNKSSFDLAKDEKDAARAVVTDRSEIRGVLLDWERLQNPKAAAQRQKVLDEAKHAQAEAEVEAKAETLAKGAKKGRKDKNGKAKTSAKTSAKKTTKKTTKSKQKN